MKRSMDDLLRDMLRARAADPTAACLDPETAAAFVDGTLSARARPGADAHVADCPRCQAVLAALVRSTPPPIERAWWRRPAIAWLVPAAAAATAVAIWISVPDSASGPPAQTLRDAAAPLQSSPVQPLPVSAPAVPRAQFQLESAAARLAAAHSELAREKPAASEKVESARVIQDALANSASVAQVAAASPAPAAAAAAAPEAPRTDADNSAGRSAGPSVDRITVSGSTPVVESVAVATFRSGSPLTIVSSNRLSQWRVGSGGEVQHSTDGGKTWRTQTTGVDVRLSEMGSSPSPSVCWLVGAGGVVLITTDGGQSWRRVPFPVAIDLVSVRATDNRTATIVSSDGRTFITSDAGRSWRQ